MRPARRVGWYVLLGVALALLSRSSVRAHELAGASATLIVRDGGHVEVRMQIPWSDVFRALGPGGRARNRPMTEMLGQLAAESPSRFAQRYAQATARLAHEIQLTDAKQRVVRLTSWKWPAATTVQDALRRELMSRLADGERFEHLSRLPATSEATTGRNDEVVHLKLSPLLGPALLTVIHPREQWLPAGTRSAPLRVRG